MALTQRQVRDPRKLATILDRVINDNALSAETTIELKSGETITITTANGIVTGIAYDEGEG